MAIPAAILIMGRSAHLCGSFPLQVNNPKPDPPKVVNGVPTPAPRTQLARNFHVYLELTMQAKHDANMRGYCNTVQVVGRPQAGEQIRDSGLSGTVALTGFYVVKSRMAAEVTRDQMIKRWKAQKPGAGPVFIPGVRVDASIQNEVQTDNYQYELSYWYDNQDIYVLYHCYPARK